MDLRSLFLVLALASASPCLAVDATLEGTLIGKREVPAYGPDQELATLRTADGATVTLDLGAPGGEDSLLPGDRVRVFGRPGLRNGRRVFIVYRIEQEPR